MVDVAATTLEKSFPSKVTSFVDTLTDQLAP